MMSFISNLGNHHPLIPFKFSSSLLLRRTMTDQPQLPPSGPSLPWRRRFIVRIINYLVDLSFRSDGSVRKGLIDFFDTKSPPNLEPIKSVFTSDVTVDLMRPLWLRLFTPTIAKANASTTTLPVIIFFHGGGFTFQSAASKGYDAICRRFARETPAFVVSIDYRLCPQHCYPSQYTDGIDVLDFLDRNRDTILPKNADLSKCFLAGDSAGANVAHHVAVGVCRSQFKALKVIGFISIQPFFGGEERTESELQLPGSFIVSVQRTDKLWKMYLPNGSNRDHKAANVSGPNADDISDLDFPGTIIFVGGFDPLKDWQTRYFEWLKKSKKEATLMEYPNMIHGFFMYPELPEAKQLLMQVKDFVNQRMSI